MRTSLVFIVGTPLPRQQCFLLTKIQRAIEAKLLYSCGIFLDSTVDHNIFLDKLEQYGIHSIATDWFQSYLTQS